MVQDYFLLREQISHGNAMFPFMLHEVETDPAFRERVGCHFMEHKGKHGISM